MSIDVTKAIEPRSDQQNFDDFLTGPRTVKIKSVDVSSTTEQPVSVHLYGYEGKPWKPSKTSLRCLAAIWGADASKWSELSLTLYGDPEVTWGGMKVGGIRVSHMEGLTSARTLMLTKTRGKKGATVIKPLVLTDAPKPEVTPPAVNTTALDAEFEASKTMTGDEKKAWWAGKTADEREYLKGLAAAQA